MRRRAFDYSWTRESRTRVYLERRFTVRTFDFVGWGVFVGRGETQATLGPNGSGLVELRSERPKSSRWERIAAPHRSSKAARRAGPMRDALHGDGAEDSSETEVEATDAFFWFGFARSESEQHDTVLAGRVQGRRIFVAELGGSGLEVFTRVRPPHQTLTAPHQEVFTRVRPPHQTLPAFPRNGDLWWGSRWYLVDPFDQD